MASAWQTLDRRLLVDRSPFARIFEEDVQIDDETIIRNFVHVELPDFVITFMVTPDNRVALVRQYRQGTGGYTLELPAGHIEAGEDQLLAAQRELREETGFEAASWQFLGKYIMDANRHCGYAYAYLAQDAQQVAKPDHGDLGDLTVEMLSLDEIRQHWTSGELVSAPTSLCVGLALEALRRSKEI